ncbi:MAG TPA: DUF4920 domain-containing protein [Saprospiraceae bacterium]|nr:DUF4920 domain-containing protein [Saprospiraceae bacterium]
MRILTIALLTITFLFACKEKSMTSTQDDNVFGEALSDSEITSLTTLINLIASEGEIKPVKTKGRVEAVCQSKGCWMTIVSDEIPGKSFHVNFHDYGFFVPKDIAGREVIIEGKAFRDLTSVEELQHYAEDEGKSAEEIAAITEAIEEYKFTATGVRLLD